MLGGGLRRVPYIGGCVGIASLALCGFPFLTGFYSKEPILEHVLIGGFGGFVVLVLLISFGLTACYSIRLLSGVGVVTLGGLAGLLIGGLLGEGGLVSGFFGRMWYLPDLRGGWSSFIFLKACSGCGRWVRKFRVLKEDYCSSSLVNIKIMRKI
uniref:NADH dehydrogenase subunit 5 n=1 Tax=Strigamia maritima TaxID=126957 RepID=T1IME2_STRMM